MIVVTKYLATREDQEKIHENMYFGKNSRVRLLNPNLKLEDPLHQYFVARTAAVVDSTPDNVPVKIYSETEADAITARDIIEEITGARLEEEKQK